MTLFALLYILNKNFLSRKYYNYMFFTKKRYNFRYLLNI